MEKLNYELNTRSEFLDLNSLKVKIEGKANISHTHEVGEINGIETHLQVQASNVPISDESGVFDATNVEEALLENKNLITSLQGELGTNKSNLEANITKIREVL